MENYYLIEWESNIKNFNREELEKVNKWLKLREINIEIEEIVISQDGKVFFEMENYVQKFFIEDVQELVSRLKNVIVEGELYIYFHESFCMDSYGVKIKDGKAYLIEPEIKWKIVSEIKSN